MLSGLREAEEDFTIAGQGLNKKFPKNEILAVIETNNKARHATVLQC